MFTYVIYKIKLGPDATMTLNECVDGGRVVTAGIIFDEGETLVVVVEYDDTADATPVEDVVPLGASRYTPVGPRDVDVTGLSEEPYTGGEV